jgi:phosphatidate cytidylyltransferase
MSEGEVKPRSDLGIRTLSGVAMMSVAIAAIWFGGYAFVALVLLVGIGVYWEFSRLVFGFSNSMRARALWLIGGLLYIGLACFALLLFSSPFFGIRPAILLIAGVIGTDIGAYFAGRTFGGPKIAPRISPSKTWSGLIGGMVGASIILIADSLFHNAFYGTHICQSYFDYMDSLDSAFQANVPSFDDRCHIALNQINLAFLAITILIGTLIAIIAQSGDFFESWMKRRAGVKDSGRLIPGHGGLFDRTDGLIAVAFVAGLLALFQMLAGS